MPLHSFGPRSDRWHDAGALPAVLAGIGGAAGAFLGLTVAPATTGSLVAGLGAGLGALAGHGLLTLRNRRQSRAGGHP